MQVYASPLLPSPCRRQGTSHICHLIKTANTSAFLLSKPLANLQSSNLNVLSSISLSFSFTSRFHSLVCKTLTIHSISSFPCGDHLRTGQDRELLVFYLGSFGWLTSHQKKISFFFPFNDGLGLVQNVWGKWKEKNHADFEIP